MQITSLIAAVLPVACLLLSVALAATCSRSIREAALTGPIVWALYLVATTETLSPVEAIGFGPLLVAWILYAILAGALLMRRRRLLPALPNRSLPTVAEKFGIAWLVASAAFLFFLAVYVPPNTFDGQAYHLPRVVHWIQNGSIRHYPTHIVRQDWMSPFAEYAVLHLQILARGDWLDNLVQWLAMVGSVVGVSVIAKQLGAARRGQLFAAMFCATMPMGIMAATSVKNDYVAAFWLVCSTHFLLRLRESDARGDRDWYAVILFGAAVGLAALTKGTAYIFVLPFLVWFLVEGLRHSPRLLIQRSAAIGLIFLAINGPFYARNIKTFGAPLGPADHDGTQTLLVTPRMLISNMTKISATELTTPSRRVNAHIEDAVVGIHRAMRRDVDNPETSFAGGPFQIQPIAFNIEYFVTNLGQVIVLLVLAIAIIAGRARLTRTTMLYVCAVAAGYVSFCATVRWQPWVPRLTLPLFVLLSSVAGAVAASFVERRRLLYLAGALALAATPSFYLNYDKPLFGPRSIFTHSRTYQYTTAIPVFARGYAGGSAYVRSLGCRDVGIAISGIAWEYTLWVLLADDHAPPLRISHYGVTNQTRFLPRESRGASEHPCAIMRGTATLKKAQPTFPGYTVAWKDTIVQVYVPMNGTLPPLR